MARKKVTLQWIANDSTRRATFKKRRKGLMKKASELATLCDVDACVVVYGEGESQPTAEPGGANRWFRHWSQPEVWPDVPRAAQVLARFKAMPELDQCKKMMDMEAFLSQRIDKLKEQLHKARRDNWDRETTLLLNDAILGRRPGLAGLSVEEIASLGWDVENRLHGIKEAAGRHQAQAAAGNGNVVAPAPATALQLQAPQVSMPAMGPYGIGPSSAGHGGGNSAHHQAPPAQPQASWLMEVAKAGGDLGALVFSGFGGGRGGFGDAGAGTSAAAADMPPHFGNLGAGFAWTDPAAALPPSFPPPM